MLGINKEEENCLVMGLPTEEEEGKGGGDEEIMERRRGGEGVPDWSAFPWRDMNSGRGLEMPGTFVEDDSHTPAPAHTFQRSAYLSLTLLQQIQI